MSWEGLVAVIVAGVFVFFLFRLVKKNPQAFSKENFSKSATTLGLLALFLLAVIFIGIFMLRS